MFLVPFSSFSALPSLLRSSLCVFLLIIAQVSFADHRSDGIAALEKAQFSEAVTHFKRAVLEDHNLESMTELTYIFRWKLVPQNTFPAEIFSHLQEIASDQSPDALAHLGSLYSDGLGIEVNHVKAFSLYTRAAIHSSVIGIHKLATTFILGNGVRVAPVLNLNARDDQFAFLLYSLISEEEVCQNNLGALYYRKKDFSEARSHYERAAAHGDFFISALAGYNLALMHLKRQGVNQDLVKARELFTRAAKCGYTPAKIELSQMFIWGRGGEHSVHAEHHGISMLVEIADQGNSGAQYLAGFVFRAKSSQARFPGDRRSNLSNAEKYFNLAAQQGHADALFALGELRLEENLDSQAMQHFQSAANKNHNGARLALARMHCEGRVTEKNFKEALRLILLGTDDVDLSYPDSQAELANFCMRGVIIKANFRLAEELLQTAVKRKSKCGENYLFRLNWIRKNPSPRLNSKVEIFTKDLCFICKQKLLNASIEILPCGHAFHKDCTQTWVESHLKCPAESCGATFPFQQDEGEDQIQNPPKALSAPQEESDLNTGENCLICFDNLSESDTKTLPCKHIFHQGCIHQWFQHGGESCPTCRWRPIEKRYLNFESFHSTQERPERTQEQFSQAVETASHSDSVLSNTEEEDAIQKEAAVTLNEESPCQVCHKKLFGTRERITLQPGSGFVHQHCLPYKDK